MGRSQTLAAAILERMLLYRSRSLLTLSWLTPSACTMTHSPHHTPQRNRTHITDEETLLRRTRRIHRTCRTCSDNSAGTPSKHYLREAQRVSQWHATLWSLGSAGCPSVDALRAAAAPPEHRKAYSITRNETSCCACVQLPH